MTARSADQWPSEQLDELRAMWARNIKTAAIAARLSAIGPRRTKNAVVGKVHRLGLSARPSPIKPRNENALEAQRAVRRAMRQAEAAKRKKQDAGVPEDERVPLAVDDRQGGERGELPGGLLFPQGTQQPEATLPASSLSGVASPKREAVANGRLPGVLASAATRPGRSCQWPIGEPRRAGFRFCAEPVQVGARVPYCAAHLETARRKDRGA